MAYKLIYIEDLDPSSIMHELKNIGFEVIHHNPETFENSISEILGGQFDAILIDFRLTSGKAIFDAPTIAQTLRTRNSKNHAFIPIILVSSEDIISDYYKDFSSHDLFDFVLSKSQLLKNPGTFRVRAISFIDSYKYITEQKFLIDSILNIQDRIRESLDFRIVELLNKYANQNDNFGYSRFIYKELIKCPGALIPKNILQARLGIMSTSPDWDNLKVLLKDVEYTGIFSDAYELWWSSGLDLWWNEQVKDAGGLRRYTAEQRVEKLKKATQFENLLAIPKSKFSKSTNFWTVCVATGQPIDPIDGFELYKKNLYPWQDKQYLSMEAALDAVPLFEYLKPIEKARFKDMVKTM